MPTATRSLADAAPPLLPGRFDLLGKLGEGSCGTVHKARDREQSGRLVAVKLARPGEEERLRDEAELMAEVTHPHILPVLAYGDGWLSMPLVPGTSLKDAIGAGMAPCLAARLAVQVLRALACLHAKGVLHRDVKPGNVLLHEDGRSAYLTDFGMTAGGKDGRLLGTPAYMSPEQTRGEPAGAACDVYGAAALLFHLLTGRVPFPSCYPAVLREIRKTPALAPSSVRPGLDAGLDALVLRGLEKEPSQRYPSAAVFADALEAWLDGPESRPARTWWGWLRGFSARRSENPGGIPS